MAFATFRGIIRAGVAFGCVWVALAAAGAGATPIAYSFSGTATGTLGSTPFTNAAFTATAQGDTNAITVISAGTYCNDLGPITITIGGLGTVTTTSTNLVFSNQTNAVWGFENGTCASPSGDWLDVDDSLSATYALATPIGPTSGTQDFGGSVLVTGAQTLRLTSVPLTFAATPVVAAPVPALGSASLAFLALVLAATSAWAMRRLRA